MGFIELNCLCKHIKKISKKQPSFNFYKFSYWVAHDVFPWGIFNNSFENQFEIHAFFNRQHFYKQRQAEIGKNKQMLSNTLRLNFSYFKIIHILRPRYHTKVMGHILQIKQKSKCVFTRENTWLIMMKMKIKIKK